MRYPVFGLVLLLGGNATVEDWPEWRGAGRVVRKDRELIRASLAASPAR